MKRPPRARVLRRLPLCRACKRFVKTEDTTCPFCSAPARELAARHHAESQEDRRLAEEAVQLLAELGEDVSGLLPPGWRR